MAVDSNKLMQQYAMCFLETYPDILEDLKKAHYFYRTTFKSDALELAEAEGERNVILRILSIIDLWENKKGEI